MNCWYTLASSRSILSSSSAALSISDESTLWVARKSFGAIYIDLGERELDHAVETDKEIRRTSGRARERERERKHRRERGERKRKEGEGQSGGGAREGGR